MERNFRVRGAEPYLNYVNSKTFHFKHIKSKWNQKCCVLKSSRHDSDIENLSFK